MGSKMGALTGSVPGVEFGMSEDKPAPPLPNEAQMRIGMKLRAIYNDVANEPVPDRFRQLLVKLEQAQTNKAGVNSYSSKDDGGTLKGGTLKSGGSSGAAK